MLNLWDLSLRGEGDKRRSYWGRARHGEFREDKGKDFLNEENSQQMSLTERFRKRVSYMCS